MGLLCWKTGFSQTNNQRSAFRFADDITSREFVADQVIVKFKPGFYVGQDQTLNKLLNQQTTLKKLGIGKFREAIPQKVFSGQLNEYKGSVAFSRKPNSPGAVDFQRTFRVQVNRPKNQNAARHLEEVINQLRQNPNVEYAEPVYQYESLAEVRAFKPNDPLLNNQYYLKTIRAYDAWQIEQGSTDVTIGVSDWGFALNHADLKDNIQYNTADPVNGRDDDGDGYIDNYAGWDLSENDTDLSGHPHGTNVCGISSAGTQNGKGVAGVGFNCRYLPVKIQGNGGFKGIESLIYLADRGCKVINLSWGRRGGPSAYEQEIINYAVLTKDVVLVGAAGNDGDQRYFYPASYDQVLSVAATNENDQKWMGSNYNDKVDLTAPGENIYTTTEAGYGGVGAGTSFATPMVSGAAALLRSRYPQLSAEQVRNILIKTADNIDALNPAYQGGLGVGRLNVLRALTEGYDPTLALQDKGWQVITGNDKQNEVFGLWCQVRCTKSPLENLVVKLTSTSPYVQIVKDTVRFGRLGALQSKDNQQAPFQLRLSPDAPTDSLINFRLIFTDTNLKETETFGMVLKPSYQVLQNNLISLSLANDGSFNFENQPLPSEIPNQGFRYRGENLLSGAGLMIGVNAEQVSSNVPEISRLQGTGGQASTFSMLQALRPVRMAAKDVALAGTFSDTLHNPSRIGLEVLANPYAWQDGKFAILEYQIKNVSGGNISQLQAGLYVNWDVQGAANNQTDWDEANRLGYVYNRSGGVYTGLQLLTDQPVNYAGLDNTLDCPVQVFDGFSTGEKYASMANGITYAQTSAQASDVAHVLAASLKNMQAGETRTVAFALLVGDSKVDLQANAALAREKFVELKRSPVPLVKNLALCRDTPFVISPSNGSRFRLYNTRPPAQPMMEGNLFQLASTGTDSTFYVTSVDSLFESLPAIVRIQPYRTSVAVPDTQLSLDSAQGLLAKDLTEGVVWRRWDLGDGTIVRDSAAIEHSYTEPGEYLVQLKTLNNAGCEDTYSQAITVTKTWTMPEPSPRAFLRVYPNPVQDQLWIEMAEHQTLGRTCLFNALGHELALSPRTTDRAGRYTIALYGPTPGLYRLRLEVDGKWIVKNIVVR